MSNPVEQLPRTALAATGWKDTSSHAQIRVYFQEKSGAIRESQYYSGTWKLGPVIATDARHNTPLAVTSWGGDKTSVSIRVYYLSTDNTLREMCCDPGPGPHFWSHGALNASNVKASPASQLSVIWWPQANANYLNIYYQRDDNVIQEFRFTGTWSSGKTFSKALTGTSLSAITFSWGIRVYYQDPLLNLREHQKNVNSDWTTGNFIFAGPGYTPIAAINWGETPEIRVYTITGDANIVEYAYSGSNWTGPGLIAHSNPGSFLAALTFTPDQPNIRVYYIGDSDQIKEMLWDGSTQSWAPGSTVPSGSLQ